ncbi:hypothetical protein HUK80_08190 [Flavobacterium sp. MAH-1]|uniref:7-cyano-7-deazaguanine synthase (Queuosine biosynthesis) n=1 Tax=Flavobacterium agri TaxID=2743471 RepID=A0A7Y9C6Z1_9FLAO|nr:hypothetical protein [Flavobacterium agri]NUY80869.1 hypothetical protein [Flavobacterium agri]NYA70893.1 hypothetical protein [Flavobacterium agri]
MLKLDGLRFENGGKRIVYDYSYGAALSHYFNKKQSYFVEYTVDVSQIPASIAVVPFLANFTPISWFAGFDIEVPEADATFLHSLEELKKEFAVHFAKVKPNTKVLATKVVSNKIEGDETALLFSGGLDAFEALTRNIDNNPYLVSVWGADIELTDTKRWDEFQRFNKEETIIADDRVLYVKSNLRTFYTHKVDLLVDISWWGKIQHGMALISMIAPLSWLKGINTVMIASSNTGEVSFGWGSTSETDEKVKWASMSVIHDGFHLRRTEKIENIVEFAKKTGHNTQLRVCYSELRNGKNCSKCAKCQRTMLGFILCGENPDDYGFNIPSNFYELLFKNFGENAVMTTGVAYEWRCLQEKAASAQNLHFIENPETEKNNIATFAALPLETMVNRNIDAQLGKKKLKFTLISKFPRLFQWYLKIRRALKTT